jgi:hypothetical protein
MMAIVRFTMISSLRTAVMHSKVLPHFYLIALRQEQKAIQGSLCMLTTQVHADNKKIYQVHRMARRQGAQLQADHVQGIILQGEV